MQGGAVHQVSCCLDPSTMDRARPPFEAGERWGRLWPFMLKLGWGGCNFVVSGRGEKGERREGQHHMHVVVAKRGTVQRRPFQVCSPQGFFLERAEFKFKSSLGDLSRFLLASNPCMPTRKQALLCPLGLTPWRTARIAALILWHNCNQS